MELPEYTSGCFELYRMKNDSKTDFPETYLENQHMPIWYRELAVFDRTRYEFDQGGKEITMKIRIPRYKEIDSNCVCEIDGKQHKVYNAAHIMDKNGFLETELTLIRPERMLEVR